MCSIEGLRRLLETRTLLHVLHDIVARAEKAATVDTRAPVNKRLLLFNDLPLAQRRHARARTVAVVAVVDQWSWLGRRERDLLVQRLVCFERFPTD